MEKLLKQCRYYKGEEKSPYSDSLLAWFWDMERVFVKSNGIFSGEREYFNKCVQISQYPGIPPTLLLIMFTSWLKSNPYFTDFEELSADFSKVIKEYLFIANDHYAENKIPG